MLSIVSRTLSRRALSVTPAAQKELWLLCSMLSNSQNWFWVYDFRLYSSSKKSSVCRIGLAFLVGSKTYFTENSQGSKFLSAMLSIWLWMKRWPRMRVLCSLVKKSLRNGFASNFTEILEKKRFYSRR